MPSNRALTCIARSSDQEGTAVMLSWDQGSVMVLLLLMLFLFAHGRLRYDIVSLVGLVLATLWGLVPADEAFSGFGHPAVITVAAVLVISRSLLNSGIVDGIARLVSRVGDKLMLQIFVLTTLVALCSAFINNVGALALFMPVALRIARTTGTSPSLLLMPLAFGSLLGGLTTLIGTPPNIIIATFRAEQGMEQFRMFDFAPVGGLVALAGLGFLIIGGWRLIPLRRTEASAEGFFDVASYIAEVEVPESSPVASSRIRDLEKPEDLGVTVTSLIRGKESFPNPHPNQAVRAGDRLVVRADAEDLQEMVSRTGLVLTGGEGGIPDLVDEGGEFEVMEAVIIPSSPLNGRRVSEVRLRNRYGISLLGISRQGARLRARLQRIRLKEGDVLLLQGPRESLSESMSEIKCLPLAERGLRVSQPRRLFLIMAIFLGSLAVAATGLLPVQIALVAGALAMIMTNFVSAREAYESIDWSVIVLLGCMIPISGALESTGAAGAVAEWIMILSDHVQPWVTLTVVLVATMFLSDLVNNAAATLLMAPIAVSVASGIGVSYDPFLMAVAIGASCAFLTPVGHQSNTLVMGPGGYRFSDYWRVGLPLELVIVAVAVPAILWIWPL